MDTVLIVDDEKNYLVVLEALLSPEGYEIITSDSANDALQLIRETELDLVITDMKMPGTNGMTILEEAKKVDPDMPIIIMTAHGTIEMAVEAMRKHAYDYIEKPFKNETLKLTVEKALRNYRLIKENRLLSEALSDRYRFGNIIGKSRPMKEIYDLIGKVSRSKTQSTQRFLSKIFPVACNPPSLKLWWTRIPPYKKHLKHGAGSLPQHSR